MLNPLYDIAQKRKDDVSERLYQKALQLETLDRTPTKEEISEMKTLKEELRLARENLDIQSVEEDRLLEKLGRQIAGDD